MMRRKIPYYSGVMSLIGLSKIGYPRGGPLGTFLGAFVAVTIWKKKSDLTNVSECINRYAI